MRESLLCGSSATLRRRRNSAATVVAFLAVASVGSYSLPAASATVGAPVIAMVRQTVFGLSVAAEPGGTTYFFGRAPPGGLGGGIRLDQPILWGFGLGVGLQSVYLISRTYPLVTYHPYVTINYRIDDLPLITPQIEVGAGMIAFTFRDGGRAPELDPVFHLGGILDFSTSGMGPFFAGVFVRYHLYPSGGFTPGAINLGLRAGLRFFE